MSAYRCNPEHIGVLANAMYRAQVGLYCQPNSPKKMAAALAKANWISIEARYPNDDFMLGNQSFEEYSQDCQNEAWTVGKLNSEKTLDITFLPPNDSPSGHKS